MILLNRQPAYLYFTTLSWLVSLKFRIKGGNSVSLYLNVHNYHSLDKNNQWRVN